MAPPNETGDKAFTKKVKRTFVKLAHIKELIFQLLQLKTEALPGWLGSAARFCWARRTGARLLVVTSLAAGLTWGLADWLHIGAPVVAAIGATITVQAAVHTSVKDGASRVIATVAALMVAVLLFQAIGIHAWSIAVVVAVSILAGRLIGLGPEGAMQVPATSLGVFVIGTGLDSDVISERIAATIFGVSMGVLLSSFAHRASVAQRAAEELGTINLAVSSLLSRLAQGVDKGVDAALAAAWLEESRDIQDRFEKASSSAHGALAAARWGSSRAKREADDIALQAKALEHSCEQLNSIARTLYDMTQQKGSNLIPEGIAGVLEKASDAFALNAEQVAEMGFTNDTHELDDAINDIRSERAEALGSVRDLDDTAVWLISGSIISSVDRMLESLDQSAPALKVADPGDVIKPFLAVPLPRRRKR